MIRNRKSSMSVQANGKILSLPIKILENLSINRSLIPQNLPLINIRLDKTKSKTIKHENSTVPECLNNKTNRNLVNKSRLKSSKTNRENESTFNILYKINSLTRIDLENANKSALPKITTKNIQKIINKQNLIELKPNELTRVNCINQNKSQISSNSHLTLNKRETIVKTQESKAYIFSSKNLFSHFNQIDYNCFFYDAKMESLTIPLICSRKSCTFILDGNIGLIIGGMGRKTFNEAISFDLESKTIKKQKNLLFQRTNHLTVKCGNFVFVHGGQVFLNFLNKKVLNDLFVFFWSLLNRIWQSHTAEPQNKRVSQDSPPIIKPCRLYLPK